MALKIFKHKRTWLALSLFAAITVPIAAATSCNDLGGIIGKKIAITNIDDVEDGIFQWRTSDKNPRTPELVVVDEENNDITNDCTYSYRIISSEDLWSSSLLDYGIEFGRHGSLIGRDIVPVKFMEVTVTCSYKKMSERVVVSLTITESKTQTPGDDIDTNEPGAGAGDEVEQVVYTPENYLNDITFSITYRSNSNTMILGTAWLLSRVGNSGNQYYMVTNAHVILYGSSNTAKQFGDFDSNLYYWCANNSTEAPGSGMFGYAPFISASVQKIASTDSSGIDLAILKVDFGDFGTTFFNSLSSAKALVANKAKKRLATFNAGNAEMGIPASKIKGYKTTFESATRIKKYIGGYPVADATNQASWEYHEIGWDTGSAILGTSATTPGAYPNHFAYNPTSSIKHYLDNTNQYRFADQPFSVAWMDHGASGSAVVDEYFNVSAIYWGGYENRDFQLFYPMASIIPVNSAGSNFWNYLS